MNNSTNAFECPAWVTDKAERHNFAQDVFSSRRHWKTASEKQRQEIIKALPGHVEAYLEFHKDLSYDEVSANLNKWL